MASTIRTTIDAGGRVVIPKPFREELGLMSGSRVDIVVAGLGITITPVAPEVELVRKGRVLVARHPEYSGPPIDDDFVRDLIEADREERIRRFL